MCPRTEIKNAGRGLPLSGGFTVIEAVVVVAVLGILATMAFSFVGSSTRYIEGESRDVAIGTRSWQAFEAMLRELRTARLVYLSADGAEVRVMVPIDPRGDGSYSDADGNPAWGAVVDVGGTPRAVPGAVITWRFTGVHGQAAFEVLDEAADRVDYNRNVNARTGLASVYIRGCITRQVTGEQAHSVLEDVVQLQGNIGKGDIDGDGAADPVFSLANPATFTDANGNGVPDIGELWDGLFQVNIWCIYGQAAFPDPSIVNRRSSVRMINYR
jgi:type II secretory pathway pseudopilin PulG